jgi:hypothetical protein
MSPVSFGSVFRHYLPSMAEKWQEILLASFLQRLQRHEQQELPRPR